MTDAPARPPSKKTEMIEVRVSHETKREFLQACRGSGRTASDVIRESIQDFIDQRRRPQSQAGTKKPVLTLISGAMRKKRYVAAGAAVVGISLLAALPSAAAPDLAAAFRKLDANGDGVLSDAEFGKRNDAGVKQMEVRKLQRGVPLETEVDPSKMRIFVVPAPAEGEAYADLLRDVRVQVFGSSAAAEDRGAAAFKHFDGNGDGKIDLDEFLARQKLLLANGFASLDKDGSGGLDAAEYSALGQPLLITPPGAILEFGISAKYGPVASQAAIDAEFAKRDADNDGKLSLKEYLQPT
jgi:Ca2+-binding EF-hand superfamily protein/Arc/MetJ-type ribon-helix-helix transcriptional regulator